MKKENGQESARSKCWNKFKMWSIGITAFLSSTTMFGQKNYNDSCNGSLAWLSSTTETRGAPNPAAVISANKTYRGLNQFNRTNVKKLNKFINSDNRYKEIHGMLKFGAKGEIIDASWKETANKHKEVFTKAQEDFTCEVYIPDCFMKLQKELIQDAKNKGHAPVMLSDVHPAVLSLFVRSYIKAPGATKPATELKKAGSLDKINNENFIKNYVQKDAYLENKALSAFHDNNISWNQAQLTAACSKARIAADGHMAETAGKDKHHSETLEARKPLNQKEMLKSHIIKPIGDIITQFHPVSNLEQQKNDILLNMQRNKKSHTM